MHLTAFTARRPGAFVLIALSMMFTSGVASSTSAGAASETLDRTISDSRITESSGLARSTYARGALFTHNDSGGSAKVYAVDRSGGTKAVLTLGGVKARDWEDISSGPNHTLWVADIGDNARVRSSISVHRFAEPSQLASSTVNATSYSFAYPDGPHNAEGLMVHPVSGRLYIVTKASSGAGIYAAPSTLSTTRTNNLTRVASAPSLIKAATFSPDGRRFILSGGSLLYVYDGFGDSPVTMKKPPLKQGESAEITRGGGSVLVGSEGADSPVYRLAMP